MKIWALADLHLSFGVPEKSMEVFGPNWKDYTQKIEINWQKKISKEDLVLIAGDLSWAQKAKEVLPDLEWLSQLNGIKILLKGNHDHWWSSKKKVEDLCPPSFKIVQNNSCTFNGVTIGGGRLWDTQEYNFSSFIEFKKNPRAKEKKEDLSLSEKQFEKELLRLRMSLETLDPKADLRIAMTHFPPIGADLQPSKASKILEEFQIDVCVFGHLHNVRANSLPFGEKNGVLYLLTSADYINFDPILIKD